MRRATVLVSSWSDGVVVLSPDGRAHELQGRRVSSLAAYGRSGAVAVVDGTTLMRRSAGGEWTELARPGPPLSSCLAVDDAVYVGSEGARLLRVRADGSTERVEGFDVVEGRASWFAGSAVVDGEVVGPPLAVRSLTASADGRVVLAAVHVGGIPRSADGGLTWRPTIDMEWDVHEVRIHPGDPAVAIAACAVGLCVSHDGGASWVVERPGDGPGAASAGGPGGGPGGGPSHCSAVAFAGRDALVSVSDGPFAAHGTVLRRSIDAPGALRPVGGGLPDRLDGIVDTGCIASSGDALAVADRGGTVYASGDGGRRWLRIATGVREPSGVLIL